MEMRETASTAPDYKTGLKLLSERKFDDALKEFRRVVTVNPGHAEANFQVGRLLLEANRADQAIHSFSRAVDSAPTEPQVWAGWAEAVALGGKPEDRGQFLAALKGAKIDPRLRVNLQDRFGSNSKSAQPARGGLPSNRAAKLAKLFQAGKYKDTEVGAKRALAEHPKSAAAAGILAAAQHNLGKIDQAIASNVRAIKLDPGYSGAYENLGRILLNSGRTTEAIGHLKKAVILSPDMTTALASLGSGLNRINMHKSSVVLLERAVELDAEMFESQIELGNAYQRTGEPEKAIAAYMAAQRLAGAKATNDHLAALGQAQSKVGDYEAALENFDTILERDPDFTVAITARAHTLQSLGRFDEAREAFRRAIEVDPTNGENYRSLVHSHRAQPGEKIIDDMIQVFARSDLRDNDRVHLGFALSKALEDVGEYQEAFKYLNKANELNAQNEKYYDAKRQLEVKSFQNAYRKFDYGAVEFAASDEPDPIFVTGMPRSGTTLIEQIIASHSQVSSAGETGFAPKLCHSLIIGAERIRPLATFSSDELAQLRSDYREAMEKRVPGASLYTDKTITTYMHIGMLKLAMPNARFIVVRRDPRDNLLSMYKNKFPEGTHPHAYDLENLAHYYDTFVKMIDFWRELIPAWFYEVQYETLVSNPEEESRKLIDACGLEWEDACLNFHQNKNRVQTLSVYQVRQPISKGSVKGWKRYEKELEPMLKILREAGHVSD